MKKLLFIVNPKAGVSKSVTPLYNAVSTFSKYGYLVNLHETTGKDDAKNLIEKEGKHYDFIVCAGGDGTFNETISGIMTLDKKPNVGYLPCGSTNDFATSIGLSNKVSVEARNLMVGSPLNLDIGKINDRYFTYVACFGAFTRASYSATTAAKNTIGHLAYIFEGAASLDSLKPYECTIVADGEELKGTFLFGAVANSTSFGGVMRLAADEVQFDDGKFELFLVKYPKNLIEFNEILNSISTMKHDNPNIILRHVKNVKFSTKEEIPWSLDGEYFSPVSDLEIQNIHNAVNLIV